MTNYINLQDNVIRYYKIRERVWKKPTLNRNGFVDRHTPSCWASTVIDGNVGSQSYNFYNGSYSWHAANWQNQNFYWYNPLPLRLRHISFKMYRGGNGNFYASKDGTNWILLQGWSFGSSEWDATLNLEFKNQIEAYNYFRIETTWAGYTGKGYNYTVLAELYVNAMEQYIEEVAENDDYDFAQQQIDNFVIKTPPSTYTEIQENISLPRNFISYFGGDSRGGYIVNASHSHKDCPPWYVCNGKDDISENCWYTNHGVTSKDNSCWWQVNSEYALSMRTVSIKNELSTPDNFKHGKLQGSNDGVTWVDLLDLQGTNEAGYISTWELPEDTDYYFAHRLWFDESFSTGGVSIQAIHMTFNRKIQVTCPQYNMLIGKET